jgi:hypothetical protein
MFKKWNLREGQQIWLKFGEKIGGIEAGVLD